MRAAVRLFQTRGFHGVGTAEILQVAEVPRGSLYHHFPGGKGQLAAAAAAWVADEIVRAIQELRLDGADPAETIERLAAATTDWLRETKYGEGGLLAALTVGLGPHDTDLSADITTAYRRIEAEYARALVAGGVVPSQAEAFARAVVVTGEGAMLLARALQDADIVARQLGQLAAAIREVSP